MSGGGAIGVELAQAIHRFGADVVLVEGMDHLLPRAALTGALAVGPDTVSGSYRRPRPSARVTGAPPSPPKH